MENLMGLAEAPLPQTAFSQILLENLCFYCLPIFSPLKLSKGPSKDEQGVNRL